MLVTTPFGIGVKDSAWLDHRLTLTSSITAPSLLAQSDPNFRWILFADADLPIDVRGALEEILAPFEGRAIVYSEERYRTPTVLSLASRLGAVATGYVLTGRIDDDDAWSTRVVKRVRDRASRWIRDCGEAPGLGFTYENGFEWIMYDMVDVDVLRNKGRTVRRKATIRPYVCPFLGTSVFVLSTPRSRACAISAGHGNMGRFLEKKGYEVDVISTERPMWLYCRHKQAGSAIQKAKGSDMEVDLADLSTEFGLDEGRTTQYLAGAEAYGYGLVKRIKRFRPRLEREFGEVCRQIDDAATDELERSRLERRKVELSGQIAELSENVVGDLDTVAGSHRGDDLG